MPQKLQILMLEDQPADAELVMRELRKAGFKFAAKRVATEADFLAQLREAPPDVILADHSLPGYNGLAALAAVQKACPEIPFIFVSGTIGEENAIEALHRGATDYVLKQRLSRLGPAVKRALRETEQRGRRMKDERRIHEMNLLLRASRDISALINCERDPGRLLAEACNILVQTRGYCLAWIGLPEPGSKRVVPAARAGDRADYLDSVRITWDDTPSGQGPTGTAMRTGQPWICQDTATDPRFAPWREAALARGYTSLAAVPMMQETRITGVVTVYSYYQEAFNAEEMALLQQLAGDLALALQGIKHEKEHEAAETALVESRGLRKAILDNIPDPAWLKDTQGRFLACNESLAQRYGRRIEDILGKTVFDTIPAEAERMTLEDQEVLATGKPVHTEKPIIDAQGQKRWFDTIKSPIFNERGEVTGIVGIARDTTERWETDGALRVSEDRFRSVWEHSIDGMRLMDREGRILAVNEAFCRLVKLPREKLIGEVFSVAYEDHGTGEDIEAYRRRFDAGTLPPRITGRARLWNGEGLDVEVSGSFIELGLQGKTLLSIFRDVTERKRAEVRMAAFSSLGQQLSAAQTAREAGEIIVAVADRLLGWDACSLVLYSSTEKLLRHVLSRDTVDGQHIETRAAYDNSPPSPLARRVIKEGGQLILKEKPDQMAPGGEAFGHKARPSASILFVPARAGAEVVGLLSIHSYTPKAYDQRGLETLQTLADHCAGALKRISAQEARTASEANYRSLVERSPYAILLHRDGTFIYANPASVKLLGAKKLQQVIGLAVFDTVPPENHDLIRQRIRRAAEGGTTPPLAQKLLRLDGTSLDIEATSIPCTYEGRPAVQTIMQDTTERKKIEERLRESERKYRAMFDQAQLGIYQSTVDGRLLSVNRAAAEMAGYGSPEEMVNATNDIAAQYFVRPEKRPEIVQAACQSDKSVQREVEFRRKDGTPFPVNLFMRAVRGADGKVIYLEGFVEDISRRKQAEESHARLATAVEQSDETIVITDTQGTILYVNPAFEKSTGYTRAEALGQNPRILKSGKQDAEHYRRMWEVLGRGEVWNGHFVNQRKDGTLYEEEACISPMRDAAGRIVNYVAVKRDVTHEVQLEQQLRQSQKMDAIGQLAGGVAHDFNNMLAVIRGHAELLLMDQEEHTPDTKEALKQVVAASERAANLTRQLLAFSRKQVMQSRPLVLNDAIADLTKMLRRIIGEQIDLQCRYAAQLPFVQADAGMIEQVLLNLAVNARDAMPRGGQLLVTTETARFDADYARTHPEAGAGEFVCLTVSDTGTGIAPEHLPRIFEPFFTTKEVGKGTGLGLATVYGIVKQHQGWIEVASQPGTGATFKIFLPVIPTPANTAATLPAEAELPGGDETILLVEDDYAVRVITRRVLESRGYKIYEATNAEEALDLWRSRAEEIALLLTDIVMPQGVTGRDLAEQLRTQRPALRVIFMSGYSADVIGKDTDFFQRTHSSFLQKPCSSRALLETVRHCLDAK